MAKNQFDTENNIKFFTEFTSNKFFLDICGVKIKVTH